MEAHTSPVPGALPFADTARAAEKELTGAVIELCDTGVVLKVAPLN
jgi:hypothetical protein